MEPKTLAMMREFCDPNFGAVVALQPHALPSHRVVFATDCRIVVLRREEDAGTLPVPDGREAAHLVAILDAGAEDKWHPVDLDKLRRWSGPVSPPCYCDACHCDESRRSDPCWFGPRVVNRHYLAMITRLLGGGEARISIPSESSKPILIDKGVWRVALMPMTVDPESPRNGGDLPRFEIA